MKANAVKKSVIKIMTICLVLCMLSFLPLCKSSYAETNNIIGLDNAESIIREHFNYINEDKWEEWANTFIPSARPLYSGLVSNSENIENNLGILTVDNVEILTITKLSNEYAPMYVELQSIISSGKYCCYVVDMNITVKEETKYFQNGACSRIVMLAEENGIWGVGANCNYIQNNSRGISYGFIKGNVNNPPETIVVDQFVSYNSSEEIIITEGNPIEVDFEIFVIKTVLGEIGTAGFSKEAIKAVTVSDKMFSWWCALGHYRDTLGCDIVGMFDVAFDPDTIPGNFSGSVLTTISSVLDWYVVSENGLFFAVGANNYTTYDYEHSGVVVQSGAERLSTQLKYDFKDILKYYLNDSTYNLPQGSTTGEVIIGESQT